MRTSTDTYKNGSLYNGFNYETQQWYFQGKPDTRTTIELLKAIQQRECHHQFNTHGKPSRQKHCVACGYITNNN